MPDGVVADDCTFTQGAVTMAPPLPALTYRGAGVSSYQYIVFRPDGSLLRGDPSSVRLVSGIRNPGGAGVTYTAARGSDGKAANYYRVHLLPANGRVKVERP
jgi:hypothetical protein